MTWLFNEFLNGVFPSALDRFVFCKSVNFLTRIYQKSDMSFEPKQIEMVCLEDLVSPTHIYRKFLNLWKLDSVRLELEKLEAESDYKGYGMFRIFLCLLLQFLEDLSDRELERFIAENASAKWFCQFGLVDKTPDHSVFGRVRSRIGTNKLSKIFSLLRDQLKAQGYMSEVFTFIDATSSHLKSWTLERA